MQSIRQKVLLKYFSTSVHDEPFQLNKHVLRIFTVTSAALCLLSFLQAAFDRLFDIYFVAVKNIFMA